jgi:hypothetical protein
MAAMIPKLPPAPAVKLSFPSKEQVAADGLQAMLSHKVSWRMCHQTCMH